MTRRVAITGLGLISSQGSSPEAAFAAWCRGESGIGLHTVGNGAYQLTVPYALCTGFDAAATLGRSRLATMDRVSQLSTVAAASAWQDAGLEALSTVQRDEVCVLWGTGGGGAQTLDRGYCDLFLKGRSRISPLSVVLGMNNAAASHIALHLSLGSACLTYSVACASSAIAVGEAFKRIHHGEAELVVAGGAEAGMPFGMLKAWESLQVMAPAGDKPEACCQPFGADRSGLVLGEGAAALVLEDWERAKARGVRIYGEIIGYGSTCDHSHLTAPHASGQVRALTQALRGAKLRASDIQYVNAHGTATKEGDPTEIEGLKTLLGAHAPQVMVSSTKSMHGHLLGAAGAIEIMATVLALYRKVVPPTAHLDRIDEACAGVDHVTHSGRVVPGLRIALCNSFAFGGSNAVLALRATHA